MKAYDTIQKIWPGRLISNNGLLAGLGLTSVRKCFDDLGSTVYISSTYLDLAFICDIL